MRTLLVAFALLIGVAPLPAIAGTTGSIAGYVVDFRNEGISGAVVTIESGTQVVTTITDARGYYCILDLTPGSYRLTAQHRSYQIKRYDGVVVYADEQTIFHAHLPWIVVWLIDYHDPLHLVGEGTTSDAYGLSRARVQLLGPVANVSSLRLAPGVYVPLVAPPRAIY